MPALTRLQQVKANLQASRMQRMNQENQTYPDVKEEDSILDKIEMKESIYDEASYEPSEKVAP